MTAFIIANVLVTDDKWVPEYAARVHDIAAKHGGKYLSRSGNIEVLSADPGRREPRAALAGTGRP